MVAVLALTLGIGANAAIFQLIDVVRLRTLLVKDPNTLAIVHPNRNHWGSGNFNSPYSDFTFPLWQQIRPRQEPFSSIAVWGPARLNLATGGEVRNANAIWVNGDFFRALHPRRSHGGVAIRVVFAHHATMRKFRRGTTSRRRATGPFFRVSQ